MNFVPESDTYTKFRPVVFTNGISEISVLTRPGLPNWDELLPGERLLMERFQQPLPGQTVLLGCRHGALAVHLARLAPSPDSFTATDTHWLALECTRRSLELNQISGGRVVSSLDIAAGFSERDSLAGQVDTVVIVPPRGRGQGRAWLALAASLLRAGGQLFLAGANDEGIQSLMKDAAALFGACNTLSYRKGSRAAFSIRSQNLQTPDWMEAPGVRPGSFLVQKMTLDDGQDFTINSLPGVFSYEHLDSGSVLLLSHLTRILYSLPAGAKVLDVGCGYGILGLAAARRLPEAQVSMVDVDLAAVACAQRNTLANDIPNAEVFPSDLLDACANQRYHLILSNPPFHAGKQVSYAIANALIGQARDHLLPGGSLVLVSNRFIRYEKIMQDYFPRVETLAVTNQFHLLRGLVGAEHKAKRKKEI